MKKTRYNSRTVIQVFYTKTPGWLSVPRPGKIFGPGDFGVALIAALLAFALYVRTLGPTITGEDSGEFVVAAYALGIPHPPGYPIYCMIGHLFSRLPFGEAAWRVNLMSAVFAGGAVFLTALIVTQLTRNRFAALAAGLALACSREFWAQAVIAEVYAMNAFWFALCLVLLLCWTDTRKNSTLLVLALWFGVGITVHNTFLLLIPPFVVYVLFQDARNDRMHLRRLKFYILLAFVAALGMLVYMYLPIRSRMNPPLDWGNPENLTNFYHVIRRRQYDFMFHQYPRSASRFVGQLVVYGRFWLGEFMPWGAVFGAGGLALLAGRRLAYTLLLVFSALLIVAGFSFWQNFEQTREWLWVMRVFGIPAYMVTAIGIGVGIEALWRRSRRGAVAAAVMALLFVAPSLCIHWSRNDKSDYYWTRDYGWNILNTLAPDALYVSESDHGSFSVLYLQVVFGMRPDVESLRNYGYLHSPLFAEMPEEMRERIGEFPKRRHDPEILAWLLEYTERPLYIAKPMPLPGMRIVPAGLLFRVLRPGEHASETDYWAAYRWHTLSPEATRNDYTADVILFEIEIARAHALLMEAARTISDRKPDLEQAALDHIEQGLRVYGRDPVILNNVGVMCARYGLYLPAKLFFEEALKRLPHLPQAQNNLERATQRLLR